MNKFYNNGKPIKNVQVTTYFENNIEKKQQNFLKRTTFTKCKHKQSSYEYLRTIANNKG